MPIEICLLTVVDLKRLEEQARDGPSDPNALAKWRILNRLHDRNETMYYKVSCKLQYSSTLYGVIELKSVFRICPDWLIVENVFQIFNG